MYSYIKSISKRCHRSATQRGKDTSCVGCLKYLHGELTEYWRACDEGCVAYNIDTLAEQVMELPREEYIAYYDDHIHNTTLDELADILITAASYYESARLADESENLSGRTLDEMFIDGAVHFIYTQIQRPADMAALRQVLLLKMLYNELRND
jgi:hypothetical protein